MIFSDECFNCVYGRTIASDFLIQGRARLFFQRTGASYIFNCGARYRPCQIGVFRGGLCKIIEVSKSCTCSMRSVRLVGGDILDAEGPERTHEISSEIEAGARLTVLKPGHINLI